MPVSPHHMSLPTARDLGLSTDASRPVPDAAATPQPVEIEVLFEDDVVLVVNKPAGLATMPRGRYVARSVVAQLRWARRDPRIVPAHRLDRLTSGVLVLIKEPAWRGRIQVAFERRTPGVEKTYAARTVTQFLDSDYVRDARHAAAQAGEPAPWSAAGWEPATTRAEPLEVVLPMLKERGVWQTRIDPAGALTRTLLQCRGVDDGALEWRLAPRTGYTHQLRVTLAALGYPICGDPLYPAVSEEYCTDAGDGVRMCLHARSLRLPQVGGVSWPLVTAPAPWESGS